MVESGKDGADYKYQFFLKLNGAEHGTPVETDTVAASYVISNIKVVDLTASQGVGQNILPNMSDAAWVYNCVHGSATKDSNSITFAITGGDTSGADDWKEKLQLGTDADGMGSYLTSGKKYKVKFKITSDVAHKIRFQVQDVKDGRTEGNGMYHDYVSQVFNLTAGETKEVEYTTSQVLVDKGTVYFRLFMGTIVEYDASGKPSSTYQNFAANITISDFEMCEVIE